MYHDFPSGWVLVYWVSFCWRLQGGSLDGISIHPAGERAQTDDTAEGDDRDAGGADAGTGAGEGNAFGRAGDDAE